MRQNVSRISPKEWIEFRGEKIWGVFKEISFGYEYNEPFVELKRRDNVRVKLTPSLYLWGEKLTNWNSKGKWAYKEIAKSMNQVLNGIFILKKEYLIIKISFGCCLSVYCS